MNIDLHSHFFPIEALQNPGKYQDKAPKIVLDKGRLTVTSGGGMRGNLAPSAHDAAARIQALDEMKIDLQAISPSPILLFYWDEPAAAAYFSRIQNEAIQAVVKEHPDRFVGFGSVPLQSVQEAISIAQEAKTLGLKGLEIGTSVSDKPLDDPVFESFYETAEALDLLLFVHPTEDGIETDDPLTGMLGNVLQFPYRTTQMVERMILKGMFDNIKICGSVSLMAEDYSLSTSGVSITLTNLDLSLEKISRCRPPPISRSSTLIPSCTPSLRCSTWCK